MPVFRFWRILVRLRNSQARCSVMQPDKLHHCRGPRVRVFCRARDSMRQVAVAAAAAAEERKAVLRAARDRGRATDGAASSDARSAQSEPSPTVQAASSSFASASMPDRRHRAHRTDTKTHGCPPAPRWRLCTRSPRCWGSRSSWVLQVRDAPTCTVRRQAEGSRRRLREEEVEEVGGGDSGARGGGHSVAARRHGGQHR